jgi:diguanylate cyclase (GGDEF)-like protein
MLPIPLVMREPWSSGWRRILWPSILAALLPFMLLWLPPAHWRYGLVAVAGALTIALAVTAVAAPWERLPAWSPSTLPFAYLIVIALLRRAGGPTGVTAMVLLPVFWLGLFGTRRQLWALLVVMSVLLLGPLIVVGGAEYPPIAWRTGILFLALSSIIGITMQALVAHVRHQERARDELLVQLEQLAHTDALTGLCNRRAWESELARGLARAARTHEPVSVALIDIDSFKAVNDLRGHAGGDRLLTDVARLWTEVLRPDDVLARIGGDEFAIVMPACTEAEAAEILLRLRARMPAPSTCSIGLATWDNAEGPDRLMGRADDALYEAKRAAHDREPDGRVYFVR